jgi:hypothetical protein
VHYLLRGDVTPIRTSNDLIRWSGGQGLQWSDSLLDELQVTYSTGHFGGFALYGSGESADDYSALTGMQPKYGFVLLCTGTWVIYTRTFERYTYASRQAGPLVPLVYQREDRLLFGLSGLFTREDEWSLSGDPRAPNTFFSGTVIQPPASDGYMLIQTST